MAVAVPRGQILRGRDLLRASAGRRRSGARGPGDGVHLSGYLWTWSESQVLVAVKLLPLGQSAGQRLLHRLIDGMPPIIQRALELPDEAIGDGAPSQTPASALHETQCSRLFRS